MFRFGLILKCVVLLNDVVQACLPHMLAVGVMGRWTELLLTLSLCLLSLLPWTQLEICLYPTILLIEFVKYLEVTDDFCCKEMFYFLISLFIQEVSQLSLGLFLGM